MVKKSNDKNIQQEEIHSENKVVKSLALIYQFALTAMSVIIVILSFFIEIPISREAIFLSVACVLLIVIERFISLVSHTKKLEIMEYGKEQYIKGLEKRENFQKFDFEEGFEYLLKTVCDENPKGIVSMDIFARNGKKFWYSS